jgi:hypothetical protein
MSLFIKRFLVFCLLFALICAVGLLTPPTVKESKYLLYAKRNKDSLLVHTASPRLILVSGSNLTFGINSNILKDSLHVNPINAAMLAGIGLKFMLDNTSQFIKKGDVILVVPEYDQYYGNLLYGSADLVTTVFGVSKSNAKLLSLKQWVLAFPDIIKYACIKYNIKSYFSSIKSVYVTSSINAFGDVVAHWKLKKQPFGPAIITSNVFQNDAINELIKFRDNAQRKGATVLISYPVYQDKSFDKNIKQITKVENALIKNNFKIIGTPARYRFADSLFYDSYYHLNGHGVEVRTKLLAADLKAYLAKE